MLPCKSPHTQTCYSFIRISSEASDIRATEIVFPGQAEGDVLIRINKQINNKQLSVRGSLTAGFVTLTMHLNSIKPGVLLTNRGQGDVSAR